MSPAALALPLAVLVIAAAGFALGDLGIGPAFLRPAPVGPPARVVSSASPSLPATRPAPRRRHHHRAPAPAVPVPAPAYTPITPSSWPSWSPSQRPSPTRTHTWPVSPSPTLEPSTVIPSSPAPAASGWPFPGSEAP